MAKKNPKVQKQRVCVYCGTPGKSTREHVINESVYHEFFGKPMQFIVQYSKLGEKNNKVDRIRDVCDTCNNVRLQPYDTAAIAFAKAVKRMQTTHQLPFTHDTEGWLLKTHCNILRKYVNPPRLITHGIYAALRDHTSVPRQLYHLMLFVFLADNKLFNTKAGMQKRTWQVAVHDFEPQRIMRSYFRLNHLETFLYLPNDDDYTDVSDRIQSVLKEIRRPDQLNVPSLDIDAGLKQGSFEIVEDDNERESSRGNV